MTDDDRQVSLANHLAGLLADSRGAEILATWQKAAATRALRQTGPRSRPGPRVGPWSVADSPDGPELVRDASDAQTRRLWADVDRVPGKGSRQRVVLVGESMARGYLLDPVLTPALCLQDALDRSGIPDCLGVPDGYQCVDLARTGAGVADLARVVRSIPGLDADVLVLAAGNNWFHQQLTTADCDLLADAISESGVAGLRRTFSERVVMPRIRSLLHLVAEAARSCSQVIIVVPEFNLVEWEPGDAWPAGALPAGRGAQWHRCHEVARAALGRQAWEEAVQACDMMRELDGGHNPLPGRLSGNALLALGDHEGARRSWEAARDAVTGQLLVHTPRVTAPVQDALAAFAAEHRFSVVDMRRELAAPDTGLPDPRFFLDYCHLSAAGMAALGRAVAERITGTPVPAADQLIPPRQLAVAHLMAACHNAWHGQPAVTLRRHIDEALRQGGGAEAATLAALLASPARSWMTHEFDALCRFPHAERYLSPNTLQSWQTLARGPLPAVLAERLGTAVPGTDRRASDGFPLNLLADLRDDVAEMTLAAPAAFYRTCAPVFRSTFGIEDGDELRIGLTYRTPHADEAGAPGRLEVNGTEAGELPPSRTRWRTIDVRVPAQASNTVIIRWPYAEQDEGQWRAETARALRTGRQPVLLPVRGELFRARVTAQVT